MDREHGLRIIITAVTDCLDLDGNEVTPSSRVIDDLGADSLDLVDLLFTLEKRFGVKLREGGLDFLSRLDLSDPAVMHDGVLTEQAVRDLQVWLPELATIEDRSHLSPGRLFSLITVETLWRVVELRLTGAREAG